MKIEYLKRNSIQKQAFFSVIKMYVADATPIEYKHLNMVDVKCDNVKQKAA